MLPGDNALDRWYGFPCMLGDKCVNLSVGLSYGNGELSPVMVPHVEQHANGVSDAALVHQLNQLVLIAFKEVVSVQGCIFTIFFCHLRFSFEMKVPSPM